MTEDRIETMRTFFTSRGHVPDPVAVALAEFTKRKRSAFRDLRDFDIAVASQAALLEATLGDPNKPVDDPVRAYVSGGRWIASCECGGAEIADPVTRLFMCCSCFNVAHGYAWRMLEMPDDRSRELIEQALLFRPDRRTRTWLLDETVTDLVIQNVERGFMQAGDEVRLEAEPGRPGTPLELEPEEKT